MAYTIIILSGTAYIVHRTIGRYISWLRAATTERLLNGLSLQNISTFSIFPKSIPTGISNAEQHIAIIFFVARFKFVRNAISIMNHKIADAIMKGNPFFCLTANSIFKCFNNWSFGSFLDISILISFKIICNSHSNYLILRISSITYIICNIDIKLFPLFI